MLDQEALEECAQRIVDVDTHDWIRLLRLTSCELPERAELPRSGSSEFSGYRIAENRDAMSRKLFK